MIAPFRAGDARISPRAAIPMAGGDLYASLWAKATTSEYTPGVHYPVVLIVILTNQHWSVRVLRI